MSESAMKSCGELRDFVTTTMKMVRDQGLDVDVANSVHKLAGQVNENLYAEIKTRVTLGTPSDVPLGSLALGQSDSAP